METGDYIAILALILSMINFFTARRSSTDTNKILIEKKKQELKELNAETGSVERRIGIKYTLAALMAKGTAYEKMVTPKTIDTNVSQINRALQQLESAKYIGTTDEILSLEDLSGTMKVRLIEAKKEEEAVDDVIKKIKDILGLP